MYADVIFPLAAPGIYTYALPPALAGRVAPGSRVRAELGRACYWGIVDSMSREAPGRAVKPILDLAPEEPLLRENLLKFFRWLSEYYQAPPGEVLRAALPAPILRSLEKKASEPGVPDRRERSPEAAVPEALTSEQAVAFKALLAAFRKGDGGTFLLQGITGSGKSHVYYALAKEVLSAGRNVMVLVPEIALTSQVVRSFEDRFGAEVALYHSGRTDRERAADWMQIRRGQRRIVIGVRSALFTPVPDLGLIVVDEEHDGSYAQSDRQFNFNGRDAAVMRGKIEGALVVLGSATPSLESRHNADQGKYTRLCLEKRYNDQPLPSVNLVDMRAERERDNWSLFSAALREGVAERLRKGEQIILLKNRRGFAHFLQCRACGHIPACVHCDVSLAYHRSIGRMVCHYCDSRTLPPETCPQCRGRDLKFTGAGVEKVEEELKKIFPGVRTLRLDQDAASKRGETARILARFREREADVLIGTQMVSKGLDFPGVTLVGVVLAETGLSLPDFRAAERTFQLLTQVAGRSGRGEGKGEVVLQTYLPDAMAIRHAMGHDYEGFYAGEMESRRALRFPPFSRGVLVRFLSKEEEAAEKAAQAFHTELGRIIRADILGPSPAPLYRIRRYFRYYLYVKGRSSRELHEAIRQVNRKLQERRGKVRVQVTFDPDSML